MKAIILAAGRGSRMGTHTDTQPKCRTMLHGQALINWQLSALMHGGANEIAIVRGYLAETFDFDVTYFENNNWAHSNMVTSLLQADEWLQHEPCIISYSDIIYSSQVITDLIKNSSGELVLAYDCNWLELWSKRFNCVTEDAETFLINNGEIKEIGGKITDLSQVNGQYMGLMKMTPEAWSSIKNYLSQFSNLEIDQLDMTRLLKQLLASNFTIQGVKNEQPWYEVDSPNDLDVYQDLPRVYLT